MRVFLYARTQVPEMFCVIHPIYIDILYLYRRAVQQQACQTPVRPKGRIILYPSRPSVPSSVSNLLCAQLLQFPSELVETCYNESP